MTSVVARRRIPWCGLWITCVCCGWLRVADAQNLTVAPDNQNVTFIPYLSGQELVTDNVLLTPTNARSDLVTTISPGFTLSADTPRLQGNLNYSPTLFRYAFTPGQSFIGQNLYANGTVTLAQDLLFFDARGYAALQPSAPGLTTGVSGAPPSLPGLGTGAGNSSQGVPSTELTQVTSFSASPYLVHRFDGAGTAELRYTISDTNFSGGTNSVLVPGGLALQNTTSTTNEATAAFLTGENLGPFASRLLLDSAQSTGTGVFSSSSRQTAVIDSAYAITGRLSALATMGYEDIRFGGFPPTHINDGIWAAGVQLTPAPDSKITATYGHQDGFTAPSVVAAYALTELTTLTARYSEGLSTAAQDIANNLAVSDVGSLGQLIDTRTGLPLAISNPALGLQAGLFRTRTISSSGIVSLKRDQITASVSRADGDLVAQSTQGVGTSQRTTAATLTWSHELTEQATANLASGYTHYTFPSSTMAEENLFTIGASVAYAFNPSLSGYVGCYHLERGSPQAQQRLESDAAFVGLRKNF